MTSNIDVPELDRIAFFPGQRLEAADLAALQRNHRELRWLHNRALHAWGIAVGLAAEGKRGDTTVRIEPGYAVDSVGRELILTETRIKDVPAVAAAPGGGEAVFYLVAAYLPDAKQRISERRAGVCGPEGAVRLGDEPLLDWRRAGLVKEGIDLVLAQAWVQHCRLSRPLSLQVRREARLSPQPYIASGQTPVGKTEWTAWKAGDAMIGVEAKVSTSGARFQSTPRYLAHLGGDRYLAAPPGPLVAVPIPAITNVDPGGFTLQVLIPELVGPLLNPVALRTQATAPDLVKDALGWHVVWMGFEG
jgi:hypothetical protein